MNRRKTLRRGSRLRPAERDFGEARQGRRGKRRERGKNSHAKTQRRKRGEEVRIIWDNTSTRLILYPIPTNLPTEGGLIVDVAINSRVTPAPAPILPPRAGVPRWHKNGSLSFLVLVEKRASLTVDFGRVLQLSVKHELELPNLRSQKYILPAGHVLDEN